MSSPTIAAPGQVDDVSPVAASAVLLGPYFGNQSWSTSHYFEFYRQHMGSLLPAWQIRGMVPGSTAVERGIYQHTSRFKAWWDNYAVWPMRLLAARADLFHIVDQGLAWYGSYLHGGKRIVTVHDFVAYLTWAGKLPFPPIPRSRTVLLRRSVEQIARADKIICVSRFTADCIIRELGLSASKIEVVYNFLAPEFKQLAQDERSRFRSKWFGASPFNVLHVGVRSPYKNRIGALRAFGLFRRFCPDARMLLVHGGPDEEESEYLSRSTGVQGIRFLHPVPRSDLTDIYNAADVLVFPSLYEGFGWPPLEAMACGCPVVCSTSASLPEVVGDAAVTISDPRDHEGLAVAISKVMTDSNLASDLSRAGLRRAAEFRAANPLQQVAQIYNKVCA